MINEFTARPIFGFTLCVIAYHIGVKTKRKYDYAIINPIIIATLICIAVLTVFRIPLENFLNGANTISLFLAPTTAALALSMYRQLKVIKKNLLPIAIGCAVGSMSAVLSIIALCKLLGISEEITASLIPKSVTSAIATEVSAQLGGIVPITVAGVTITGIFGSIASPYLIRWTRINNSVASGLAIGASCHALGTARAVELGEIEGSLSGIAVGLCGLITVVIAMIL